MDKNVFAVWYNILIYQKMKIVFYISVNIFFIVSSYDG